MHQAVLRLLLRLSLDHPRWVAAVILLLTGVSLIFVPRLEVKAGHSKMVAADNPPFVRFNEFLERFGSPNALALLVEGGDERLRRATVDALTVQLPSPEGGHFTQASCDGEGPVNAPGCVKAVMGRIDLEPMASWGLLYLPVADPRREDVEDPCDLPGALFRLGQVVALGRVVLGVGLDPRTEGPEEGRQTSRLQQDVGALGEFDGKAGTVCIQVNDNAAVETALRAKFIGGLAGGRAD